MIALNVGCGGDMNWIQRKTNLLRRFSVDGRYLVGVSGGRDSVMLLHWLLQIGYKNLVVYHVNHQLRGRSSETDARFVRTLAENHPTEIETPPATNRTLPKQQKNAIYASIRNTRYSSF